MRPLRLSLIASLDIIVRPPARTVVCINFARGSKFCSWSHVIYSYLVGIERCLVLERAEQMLMRAHHDAINATGHLLLLWARRNKPKIVTERFQPDWCDFVRINDLA